MSDAPTTELPEALQKQLDKVKAHVWPSKNESPAPEPAPVDSGPTLPEGAEVVVPVPEAVQETPTPIVETPAVAPVELTPAIDLGPALESPRPSDEAPNDLQAMQAAVAKLEQAQRVLDGKYTNETGHLNQQLTDLKSENTRLQGELKTAQEARTKISPEAVTRMSDTQLCEVFGCTQDQIDALGRETIECNAISSLRTEEKMERYIAEQMRPVQEQQGSIQQQQFLGELEAFCPDYDEINHDPAFHASLNTKTKDVLDDYLERGNAQGIAVIFNLYKQSRPAAPAEPTLKTPIEAQVQPAFASAPPPATQDPPVDYASAIYELAQQAQEATKSNENPHQRLEALDKVKNDLHHLLVRK